MDEKEAIARARRGDRSAERVLYDAHVERVYRLAYRMTGDEMLAQDFTQDTFIRAFDRLGGFRGESAFGSWLYSIAMSVILNGLRKVKRLRSRELGWEDLEGVAGARPDPDRLLRLQLEKAIDGLSDGMRAVFVMHDVEGYTHEEIGAVLGVPEGTSKARLSRARQALRETLSLGLVRSPGKERP